MARRSRTRDVGDLPTKPFHTTFRRTVIKAYALYGPWPKGRAPTARELNARENRFGSTVNVDRLGLVPLALGAGQTGKEIVP